MDRRHHPAHFLFSTQSRARSCCALAHIPSQQPCLTHCPGIRALAQASWDHPTLHKAGGTQGLPKAEDLWPGLLSGADVTPATLVTLGGTLGPDSCKGSTAPPQHLSFPDSEPHSQTAGAALCVAPLKRLPKPGVQRAEDPHCLTQSMDPVSSFQAQSPKKCWQSRARTIP